MGIPLRITFFTISPAKNTACFKDHEAIEVIAVVYVTAQDNAGIGNIVPAAADLLKRWSRAKVLPSPDASAYKTREYEPAACGMF